MKGQQGMDYFTGGSIIMDNAWYFGDSLKLNALMDLFITNTLFTLQAFNWLAGVM